MNRQFRRSEAKSPSAGPRFRGGERRPICGRDAKAARCRCHFSHHSARVKPAGCPHDGGRSREGRAPASPKSMLGSSPLPFSRHLITVFPWTTHRDVAQTVLYAVSPTYLSAGLDPVPRRCDSPTAGQISKPALHQIAARMPVTVMGPFHHLK